MNPVIRLCLIAIIVTAYPLAATSKEVKEKDFSGWLEAYDSLVYSEDYNGFVFFNEDKRGKYDKVLLDSVTIYGRDAKANAGIAKEASEYLTEGVRALYKSRGIGADKPGPGVLRFSAAITGVEKSKEDLKAHNVIPVSALFRGAKAATGNLNTYIDAMFEAKMEDSVTGERVAAIVRRGIGETEKKSGDEFEFEDVKPTLDIWLEAKGRMLDEFLAKRR